jgi:hypothetical protein
MSQYLPKAQYADKLLQIDCLDLHAVALYRLHRPLEAVATFNQGKRIKARMDELLA